MINCSVFIATSLDGFIARQNGDIAWLNNSAQTIEGEDYGFAEFYSQVDTLVIGRKTYETALDFAEWPYSSKRVIVLSHSSPTIPAKLVGFVEVSSGSPNEVLRHLETTGAQHIYVDGGLTIQGFLQAGLIDEITITSIPIVLGGGIPLFGPLEKDIHLQLITSHAYPNGFVQSKYKIIPSK